MIIYQVLIAASALISLALSIYTYKIRRVKSSLIYSLFMLITSIFTAGTFFELSAKGLLTMSLWRNVCQIGYLIVLPILLIMVFIYTGKEKELISAVESSSEQIKKQAAKLGENEKQLDAIIENMFDHCVVVDKEGKYIKINKAAKDFMPSLMVKKVGDWLKESSYYDLNGNKLEASAIPAARVINGERFYNNRISFKNEIEEIHFDINGTPVYDDKGEFLFGIICSHDVTELVKQSGEINRKWKDLQTIFENMSDAIYILDNDGSYIYSNRASKVFLQNEEMNRIGDGYAHSQYYDIDDNIIKKEDLPASIVLKGIPVKAKRIKVVYKDTVRYINVSATPVYNEKGSVEFAIISSREITEAIQKENIIKNQKEELLKAEIEKNKALLNTIEKINKIEQLTELNSLKDTLLTVVSHDIRNPMSSMVSLIGLLEGEKEIYSYESREIIQAVKEQIYNTYNAVENLLEWRKGQNEGLVYSPLVFEVSRIIEDIISLYRTSAETKGIQITMDIVEGVTAYADIEMFRLVLRNLLSNSVKFTDKGGRITIHAHTSGDNTIVEVKDTGVGIKQEKLNTLFSEVRAGSTSGTAGEKGMGLGLMICKDFVQRNGGILWVESLPGEGSSFFISIPAFDKK